MQRREKELRDKFCFFFSHLIDKSVQECTFVTVPEAEHFAGNLVAEELHAMKTQEKNRILLFLAVCFSAVSFFFLSVEGPGGFPDEPVFCFPFETEDLCLADGAGNAYDPEETWSGSRTSDNRLLWRSGCLVPVSFEFSVRSAEYLTGAGTHSFSILRFRETNNPRDGPFSF